MFRTVYPQRHPANRRYLACIFHGMFVVIIMGLLLVGCSPTRQGEESTPTQDGMSLPETLRAFPQQAPPAGGERIEYTSAVWGTLVLDNDCLRLLTAEDYTDRIESFLVIWPDDYWPGIEDSDGGLVVYDSFGQVAARVGQALYLSGAEIPETEPISDIPLALSSGLQEPTPPECPGPYWLAGSIEMQDGPLKNPRD